jgi:transcription antitermination protein NusB
VRRRDQRRAAVFALYEHDVTGKSLDRILGRDAHALTRALAEQADARRAELDALIESHARGWALERIAPLERSIMRVALLEMHHAGELPGDSPIPPEGAIEEAVETAKEFCGADAPGFVNGILGAVLREVRENASP